MINRVTFKFYLNEAKKKADGRIPIYLRIIVKRKKVEIALDKSVHQSEWNPEKERARKNLVLNEELDSIGVQIYEAQRTLQKEEKEIDARILKDILTGREQLSIYLIEYFTSHIDSIKRNPELRKETVGRYRITLEYLKNFLKDVREENNTLLSRVDVKFIKEFDLFLLNHIDTIRKKQLERNTVNKHLVRFKTIILKAFSEGVLKENPFKSIKIRYTPSQTEFLSQEEIDRINEIDFSNNRTLEKVRDIFLWSIYTGLRFEDAQRLSIEDIRKDSEGKFYLSKIQQKTGELVSIPLLEPAVRILRKYDNIERKITGKILPQISNQKMNVYLKHIESIAGIKKHITSHVARHTCATTILLANGVGIEGVSKWLGLNNIRSAQVYGKIPNAYLKEVAKNVESKMRKISNT